MKENGKMIRQGLVDDYCQKKATTTQLDKDIKELRGKLVALFEKGYRCPEDGPGLVLFAHDERADDSWKDIFIQYLMDRENLTFKQAKARAAKRFAEVPKTPHAKLNIAINPNYREAG